MCKIKILHMNPVRSGNFLIIKSHFHFFSSLPPFQAYENDSDSGFSLTEVVWVEEDLGNNCIEVR